jgi:peptidoglycan/LPS O-acetylase OafA/YrhL
VQPGPGAGCFSQAPVTNSESQMIAYRREIDGLRALAVVPVILFHAGFEGLRGGFVGVDVFFVISGYLITSIILSEKEAGTLRLAEFWERRARRILPTLFLVIAACLPVAFLLLDQFELHGFSKSVLGASLFYSNFHF